MGIGYRQSEFKCTVVTRYGVEMIRNSSSRVRMGMTSKKVQVPGVCA